MQVLAIHSYLFAPNDEVVPVHFALSQILQTAATIFSH